MREEVFNTQEEILNYLGKRNDRNLVQRMIKRGEIYKREGLYYLVVDESNNVGMLKERIRVLEEENKKLIEKSDCTPSVKDAVVGVIDSIQWVDVQELRDKVKELESDLEYVNWEYEKMEGKLIKFQEAIRNCYMWARDVKKDKTSRPDFKKNVLKLEEDVRWEDNQ